SARMCSPSMPQVSIWPSPPAAMTPATCLPGWMPEPARGTKPTADPGDSSENSGACRSSIACHSSMAPKALVSVAFISKLDISSGLHAKLPRPGAHEFELAFAGGAGVALLDYSEAANVVRHIGDLAGELVIIGAKILDEVTNRAFVVRAERSLHAAQRRVAEEIQWRAAQHLALGQQRKHAQHPGAERALALLAGDGIGAAQQRRRHVHPHLEVALEVGMQRLREAGIGEQPRHLVLVLARHQPVGVARHGFRQTGTAWHGTLFGGAHLVDKARIALRIGLVLIGDEQLAAARDHLRQIRGQSPGWWQRLGAAGQARGF